MSLSCTDIRILELCLDIFEVNEKFQANLEKQRRSRMKNKTLCRKIYPVKKMYYPLTINTIERNKMTSEGDRWRLKDCSILGRACFFGDFHKFKHIINGLFGMIHAYKKKKIKSVNFNIWLECESELSLLHLILFGRRDLVVYPNRNIVFEEKPDWKYQHIEIANYLINIAGLDINIQNKWGYSVLHESVINIPDLEFAKFLLQNKANPNQYTIFGSTPLIECVAQSHMESIKLLCEHGADPRLLEYGYGITPISLSRHHIEAESVIYNTLNKIRNKNKNRYRYKQEQELEYENPSYCCICGITSKLKSLYQCSRCQGPKKYCSKKCQKVDWIKHKPFCHKNRRIVSKHGVGKKEQEIVFIVLTEQALRTQCKGIKSLPYCLQRTNFAEQWAEYNLNERGMKYPKYQKRYQNKRNKRYENQKENDKSVKINYKFPVKIQIPLQEYGEYKSKKMDFSMMFCYNKSRKYAVYIPNIRQQTKRYKKLKKLIETKSDVATKAYFYAYIDRVRRLHVVTSRLLAMQPW